MKYCIMHVNDRAKNFMDYNKNILKDFEYVNDIMFFNGHKGNAWDVLNHKGIKQDVWKPYDGRTMPPLPGELGVWVSTINMLEYIVDNKIECMLVLEDDIKLQPDFVDNIKIHLNELPEGVDFLSWHYFKDQNQITELTDIGLEHIHLSHNQYSAMQATVYSYSGAKKILKLIQRKGLEYTNDCFIFRQSLEKLIDGYSIKGPSDLFLFHKHEDVKSLIDPNNERNVFL